MKISPILIDVISALSENFRPKSNLCQCFFALLFYTCVVSMNMIFKGRVENLFSCSSCSPCSLKIKKICSSVIKPLTNQENLFSKNKNICSSLSHYVTQPKIMFYPLLSICFIISCFQQ